MSVRFVPNRAPDYVRLDDITWTALVARALAMPQFIERGAYKLSVPMVRLRLNEYPLAIPFTAPANQRIQMNRGKELDRNRGVTGVKIGEMCHKSFWSPKFGEEMVSLCSFEGCEIEIEPEDPLTEPIRLEYSK